MKFIFNIRPRWASSTALLTLSTLALVAPQQALAQTLPAPDAKAPAGDTQAPAGDTQAPAGDTQAPAAGAPDPTHPATQQPGNTPPAATDAGSSDAAADQAPPAPGKVLAPQLLSNPGPLLAAELTTLRALTGQVVVEVTINEAGEVDDAHIAQSDAEALDAAALRVARTLRYAPAQRDGSPVAVRILQALSFAPPAPPPASAEAPVTPPPRPAQLRGRLLLPGQPQATFTRTVVVIVSDSGEVLEPPVSPNGEFTLPQLAAGHYQLHAIAPQQGEAQAEFHVDAGQLLQLPLPLLPLGSLEPTEVVVRGRSLAQEMERSAEAVHVVDTERDRQLTASLGEVLARESGVSVRSGGGLGSQTSFALNGLSGEQVRFFVDGVPLELAGYPAGFANVPVDLVRHVEIYRGVVPVRFGADALGGAVHLVTRTPPHKTLRTLSYQGGAFDTHRATASVRQFFPSSGVFVAASGFWDQTDNDYAVRDVEVTDASGSPTVADEVRRFHDAYSAHGARVEVGVADKPWARELSVEGFFSSYDKQLQNNPIMTRPYGDVEYGEDVAGATLRSRHDLTPQLELSTLAVYSHSDRYLLDVTECVYDWFGRCVRKVAPRSEIDSGGPYDRTYAQDAVYARVGVEWRAPYGTLRAALTPSLVSRVGDERLQLAPDLPDPLSAERKLVQAVAGAEYETPLFGGALSNIAFVKGYMQYARTEEALPGGGFARRDRDTLDWGAGDALRYLLTEQLYLKASYEYATRLPGADEVFGDGVLIHENLELAPEVSHNLNLGLVLERWDVPFGELRLSAEGFLRDTDRLVVLLGAENVYSYQNVYSARALGFEGGLGWTSPGDYAVVDVSGTYQDFRNTAAEGSFGRFDGDRIPSKPYLYGSASARLQQSGVATPRDRLALTWNGRYVHEFYRGWESVGLTEFKQVVPEQILHSLALTYWTSLDAEDLDKGLSFSAELQNLTDAIAYDYFGAQKPGRSAFFKITSAF